MNYLHDEALADRIFVAAIGRNPTDKDYANRILGTLIEDSHQPQANLVFERASSLGLMGDNAKEKSNSAP